jgi:hypothetical protein
MKGAMSFERTCLAATVLAALTLASCARTPPEPVEVEVRVTAETGSPIVGAQLRVRGDYLGTTNALGQATLRVPGPAGERLPLSLTCPAGFSATTEETALVLPDHGSPTAPATNVDLVCQTQQREAVVVVHTAGEPLSLPIKVDGVVVGQTDALGFGHVHVRATPDSSFEISLDTSSDGRLAPTNPAQSFRLATSDEVFVFEPGFRLSKARKAKRGAAARPRAARSGT